MFVPGEGPENELSVWKGGFPSSEDCPYKSDHHWIPSHTGKLPQHLPETQLGGPVFFLSLSSF